MHRPPKTLAVLLAALLWLQGLPAVVAAETTSSEAAPTFEPEELEQLVAPIALYPDPLRASGQWKMR